MLRKNQSVILDLKKSVKNSTRNCCILFTQLPIMSPRNRGTMTETRQCRCCDSLTLLQPLFAFCQFLHHCPFLVPGSYLQSHMVFPCHVASVSSLWQSLSLSFSSTNSILPEGLLVSFVCAPQFGFLWCILMTRLRSCSFGKNATEVTSCPCQYVILRGHDANLSYCQRWYLKDVAVSARFLCCKLIMSPFVIHKYLGVMEILGD